MNGEEFEVIEYVLKETSSSLLWFRPTGKRTKNEEGYPPCVRVCTFEICQLVSPLLWIGIDVFSTTETRLVFRGKRSKPVQT